MKEMTVRTDRYGQAFWHVGARLAASDAQWLRDQVRAGAGSSVSDVLRALVRTARVREEGSGA